jgi:hypothetical protein
MMHSGCQLSTKRLAVCYRLVQVGFQPNELHDIVDYHGAVVSFAKLAYWLGCAITKTTAARNRKSWMKMRTTKARPLRCHLALALAGFTHSSGRRIRR